MNLNRLLFVCLICVLSANFVLCQEEEEEIQVSPKSIQNQEQFINGGDNAENVDGLEDDDDLSSNLLTLQGKIYLFCAPVRASKEHIWALNCSDLIISRPYITAPGAGAPCPLFPL